MQASTNAHNSSHISKSGTDKIGNNIGGISYSFYLESMIELCEKCKNKLMQNRGGWI